jgi:hypothetical protein
VCCFVSVDVLLFAQVLLPPKSNGERKVRKQSAEELLAQVSTHA